MSFRLWISAMLTGKFYDATISYFLSNFGTDYGLPASFWRHVGNALNFRPVFPVVPKVRRMAIGAIALSYSSSRFFFTNAAWLFHAEIIA